MTKAWERSGGQVLLTLDVQSIEGDLPDHTWPSWPASPYSLGRQSELPGWRTRANVFISWMDGANLPKIPRRGIWRFFSLLPYLANVVLQTPICSEVRSWVRELRSPFGLSLEVLTPVIKVTVWSHLPQIFFLLLNQRGRGDIDWIPSKSYLSPWWLLLSILLFSCFWGRFINNENFGFPSLLV